MSDKPNPKSILKVSIPLPSSSSEKSPMYKDIPFKDILDDESWWKNRATEIEKLNQIIYKQDSELKRLQTQIQELQRQYEEKEEVINKSREEVKKRWRLMGLIAQYGLSKMKD